MVDNNFGYTLLPKLATLGMSPSDKKNNLRPFRTPAPSREVSLASSRTCIKIRLLNALANEILAHLPEELTQPAKNARIVPIPSLA